MGALKCVKCGITLEPWEGHSLPETMPPTVFFHLPSAGVKKFCDKCWEETKGVY